MNQDYYNKLAEKLYQCVNKKDLGEILERECWQYADMLCEDVLNPEQKQQIAIMAENLLSKIKDVPNINHVTGEWSR